MNFRLLLLNILLLSTFVFAQNRKVYVDTLKIWDGSGTTISDYNTIPFNSSGQLQTTGIADSSITSAKIANGAGLSATESVGASGNLLSDPSFEYNNLASTKFRTTPTGTVGVGIAEFLYSWSTADYIVYSSQDRGFRFTDTKSYHGNTSIMYYYTAAFSDRGTVKIDQPITCSPNTQYTFSVYFKRGDSTWTSAGGIKISLSDYDAVSVLGSSTNSGNIASSVTTSWGQQSVTHTTAADASYLLAEILVYAPTETNGEDTLYVDACAINTGASAYTWSIPNQDWRVTNTFKPYRVDYFKANRMILEAADTSSFAPLAVYRSKVNPLSSEWPYRSMVEFQSQDGQWKSKVDFEGNIWVAQQKEFVTANANGISAGHFGNDVIDWTFLNIGSSDGFYFTNSAQYIQYRYWNYLTGGNQILYGTVGLGNQNQIGGSTAIDGQLFSDHIKLSPIKINSFGVNFPTGEIKLPIYVENIAGDSTGQVQVDTTRMRLYVWREDSSAWFYSAMTKDTVTSFIPASNLRAWYRSTSLVLSDGDSVVTWKDESGNRLHLTQTDTSKRPVYKTDIVNGQPAVLFNGTDDYLTQPTPLFSYSDDSITVYVVFYDSSSNAEERELFTQWDRSVFAVGKNTSDYLFAKAATNVVGLNAYITTDISNGTGWHYAMVQTAPSGNDIELDGAGTTGGTLGSGQLNAQAFDSNATVGKLSSTSSAFWSGYIAEIIIYTKKHSSAEKTKVYNYLTNKYGL